jgi:hypothetical protein
MANDMLNPGDLAYLPGAPFTDAEVDAAVSALRAAAGWHIAPEKAETVALDTYCGDVSLQLPTRLLVSVEAITDVDRDAVVDPARYRVSRARCRVRRRSGVWPEGYERIEVEMTHGYEECPPDLLAVVGQYIIGSRRDPTVQSVSVDDASKAYFNSQASTTTTPAYSLSASAVLRRYALPELPGVA